jgi:hypothetical protein
VTLNSLPRLSIGLTLPGPYDSASLLDNILCRLFFLETLASLNTIQDTEYCSIDEIISCTGKGPRALQGDKFGDAENV